MKAWLLLLSLACVACAAPADPHKPVRGVFQMCAACQARRWPELRRFIRDAVQGGEYGQQLSLEYARADKPLLVVYGPFDQVVGRFNVVDQPQEKLHELVQNFGFSRVPASTSKVSYNAFASDVADPTAGLNNGLGNGLNSAIYNAYGVYNAYSAFGAAAGTDPNSILAGGYSPGAVAPNGLAAGGVRAQAGLDFNAAGLSTQVGALNTGNLAAVSPGSMFSTLGAASNAAAGNWGALGAAGTGTASGAAVPSAGTGAAAAAGQAGGSLGTLGAAAPAAGAGTGAAAGGLGGFGALGGGLGAFGAGGGLGSFGGGLGGGLGSAASMLGGGGSLLGAPPAAVEEKPRPYPINLGGFGRRRRQ